MLAVDTNVIVRFLTRDHAAEFARVDALIREQQIYLSTTVVLETEWVLRSSYRYDRPRIVEALRGVAGLPGIILEDASRVEQALDWMEHGLDFADALHLAAAQDCDSFVTFDRRLARTARRTKAIHVRAP